MSAAAGRAPLSAAEASLATPRWLEDKERWRVLLLLRVWGQV